MHLKNAIEFFRLVTIQAENKLSLRGGYKRRELIYRRSQPTPASKYLLYAGLEFDMCMISTRN
jgi:hypothetical protein